MSFEQRYTTVAFIYQTTIGMQIYPIAVWSQHCIVGSLILTVLAYYHQLEIGIFYNVMFLYILFQVITIDNLPHTLTIREDLYLEEKIYDLIVTEATDIWYCDMLDTNDTPFLIRQEDAGGPSPGKYNNK